ncbi:MAG: general secretion pathway protein GspB [Gammaproteobacteria bacterium]|nr:general secretion pathway protein GspB [Gammaproteobacteria bacterium]
MSYILEALRKADRERTLGDVPDLESAHWGVRRPGRSWRWLWIVVALLLFNAALLGYLLNRDGADVERVVDKAPAIPPIVLSPPVPPAQLPAPVEQPLLDVRPEVVAPPSIEPKAMIEAPPVPVTVEKPPVTVRPKVAVQPHVAPKPVIDSPQVTVPAARVVQAQQPLTETADTAETGVPEWGELSLEFRSRFALPHIDVHVYAEEPRRRFILVDLKKYREGETLQSGAVLEEIQPNSIQLYYQGTRFRVDR